MASSGREPEHVVSTREAYDHSAEQFVNAVGTTVSEGFETPIDRAVLNAFAEEPVVISPNRVIDIGCGPGRVTRYLAEQGLEIRGIDISSRMIEAARAAHPDLEFDVGSLTEIPTSDESVAGAVYWYSIITTPPAELPAVWEELDRILSSRGQILVAFQAGSNDSVSKPNAYGSATTLTFFHHSVAEVADTLEGVGLEVRTTVCRAPQLPHETTPQAFILAQRSRG